MGAARIAVDIGGTFTDVVLQNAEGQRWSDKLLTTHSQPEQALLEGIERVLGSAGIPAADLSMVLHGTTLATNALIERRGATTALLTTAGHRDSVEMAFEDRFEQYDINIDRARPLVPRHLRRPVTERLLSDGRVHTPLDPQSVADALQSLDEYGVQSIAVGLLHSYRDPSHEQRCAELISKLRPDLAITLSSEVCPEIREYERLSTACANAYVQPLMDSYLRRLEDGLEALDVHCPFLLMTSGGGLTDLDTAARFPIRLVESGPAGGAILAASVAGGCQADRVLSFDMGGTTAKLCLIDQRKPLVSRSFEVDRSYRFKKGSGLPLRIPVIEMVEIGAGGGSIAHVDKLERLRVGPRSAGSEPGPAAYGRGGTSPTVTDADVTLGKIRPERFAGGALSLNGEAAAAAIGKHIASPLALAVGQAAQGISDVVEESMAAAARAHAAEFGLDLRQRDMVAFGGAAPLHAASLARRLGVNRVIIPPQAGVGSAVGFLLARLSFEVVRSRPMTVSQLDPSTVNRLFSDMRAEAEAVLAPAAGGEPLTEQRQGYMRYAGQGHELPIVLPVEVYDASAAEHFSGAFERAYEQLYGRTIDGVDIELLSLTLALSGPAPSEVSAAATTSDGSPDEVVTCSVAEDGQSVEARVINRQTLPVGSQLDGPALITEDQTTTVVPSGCSLEVDPDGNLVITRDNGA
ncbi:MAG: hydantoinase/oxoprolinase family protein [Pseudomonadota bacterium]